MKSSLKGFNQKQLYMIVSLVFLTIVFFSVNSVRYIQSCVNQEVQAEANKSKYHALSQKIVDLNNDKTDEVRNFIATGNMEYFKNYWEVIDSIRAVQNEIGNIPKGNLIPQESQYLSTAMEDLTLLSYVDIRSMRLMTDAISVNLNHLPNDIKNYVINIEEKEMTNDEKKGQALNLLFNEGYMTEKNVITNNIMSFRNDVDERLDSQLKKARDGVQSAIRIQSLLQLFFVITFVGVLILLYLYNVKPIRSYTRVLSVPEHGMYHLKPTGSIETKMLADTFNQLYRSLLKANQAKSDFLSMITHELRTPLNSIIGYKFLFERTKLTRKQKEYLKVIENSSRHLLLLINQILDYGKIEKGKMTVCLSSFDIREMLQETVDMFAYLALDKNIHLRLQCAERVPQYVQSDPHLVNQIVINLLSNAVKFTEKGSVKIHVDAVHSTNQVHRDQLIIRVTDTGIGIKKENFARIFKAFEQGSSNISLKFGGSGLGLAISNRIAQLLNGEIKVQSKYKKGTIFTLLLPVKRTFKPEKQREYSTAVNPERFQDIPVLLVEDNRINLKMEKEILTMMGFHVTTALTGREAMRCLDKQMVRCIFLDIRLPDYSGFDIAEYARKSRLNRNATIIALTANVEEVNEKKSDAIDNFLSKPFETEKLVALLDHTRVNKDSQAQNTQTQEPKKFLNERAALRRLSGRKSLYLELLEMFLRQHTDDDREFSELLEKRQLDQCMSLSHTLKGASASVGAERLASICDEICRSLKKILAGGFGDIDDPDSWRRLDRNAGTMMQCFSETKGEIEYYIHSNGNHQEILQKKAERYTDLDQSEFDEVIRVLHTKIKHSDGYCYDFIKDHAEAIKQVLPLSSYKQLEDALHRFDFKEADKILEQGAKS